MESYRFISVERQSPEYKKLLLGQTQYRVKPMASFGLNSTTEKVVFRLERKPMPNGLERFSAYLKAFRLELLGMTLFPAMATVFYLYLSEGIFKPFDSFILLFALLAAHGAVYFLNDYYDHLNGVDRLDSKSGSQVIQRGLLPAYKLRDGGVILLIFAALAGLSIIKFNFWFSMSLFVLTFLFIYGYAYNGSGLKNLGLGELIVFLALGPFVTLGVLLCFSADVSVPVLALGFLFGSISSLLLQFKKLENILIDSKADIGTLMNRLGFDRAKKLVSLEVASLPLVFGVCSFLVFEDLVWSLASGLILGLFVIPFLVGLRKSNSPLSTFIFHLGRRGLYLHSLVGLLILLQAVWELAVKRWHV